MTRMNESMMQSFADELKKLARVNPRVGSAATLGVLGALTGGGVNYLRHLTGGNPEESGTGAAARGALAGGLGGLGIGAALPLRARQAVSRFGLRELHGLTGHMPEGETLRTMHAGAYPSEVAAVKARRAVLKAQRSGAPEAVEQASKEWGRAQDALKATRSAEEWGLTNLPGVVKSMKAHGILPTVYRGAHAQIAGASPASKALMLGLPALGVAQAALSPAPDGGKGEQLGYTTGTLVGGLASGLMPFGAGQVLQEATGHLGRAAGKGVDIAAGKLFHKNAPPNFRSYGPHPVEASDLTKGPGQSTPSETIMTARASGYPPETQV